MNDELFDALPPLREVIAIHDLRAEKKLGQNFLLDLNVTDKIVRAAGPLDDITVFEVGPGPGGLTRSLLKAGAKKVIALEIDPRAVQVLQDLEKLAAPRLSVIESDAMGADLLALAPQGPRMIIANLPYNVATPLLIGWLKLIRHYPGALSGGMILMFQREVAQRLTADPNQKCYGRLSVMAQWLCNVDKLFDLPPAAFTPPPKVTSSVIRFAPRVMPEDAPSFESVEMITGAAFGQRRKMLRSSLRLFRESLTRTGIDDTRRAETLTVDEFIALAKAIED